MRTALATSWLPALLLLASRAAPEEPAAGPSAAGPRLESPWLSIELAAPEAGLGIARVANLGGSPGAASFELVRSAPADALVWRLVLARLGEGGGEVRVDNRAPSRRSVERGEGELRLRWEGVRAGDIEDALDVTATIRLAAGGSTALCSLDVVPRTQGLGLREVDFPVLAPFGEKGGLDLAVPRGNWGVLQRGASAPTSGTYPSNDWPMQVLLAGKGDLGLGIVARDPEAWPKRFQAEPGRELAVTTYPEDMGRPGARFAAPFPFALEAYRGSWWAGAKRYRAWALGAPWAKRGPIAGQKDFPVALRRVALWWLGSGTSGEVVPRLEEAVARCPAPQAVHWYNWHAIPFDVDYPEYFPTKEGFAEGVRKLTALGVTVMPYINGRLWDTGGKGFPAARAAACKQPGGTEVYIETYGSGAKLAPMCPWTDLWQERVRGIVTRLHDECGVNAVYIDQIGSAAAVLCHDPTHGHPLGGGGHWVGGYRKMLSPLAARAREQGLVLTTENDAEPYMDTIDGFLIWLPRSDDEIPFMTAVYSGHAVYFSSPSRAGMSPDAFAMVQGRDLLWGCQLGWMGFDLLSKETAEQADYLFRCARLRTLLEPFLLEGEILGELALRDPPPTIEAAWGGWSGTHPAKLPSVVTAVWRAPDGRVALLLANLSGEPREATFRFDAADWGIARSVGKLALAPVRPGGRGEAAEVPAAFERTERLEPRDLLALELTPR